MFDFIRSHLKLFMTVMMLLIIPSFVFFGISGYQGFLSGEAPVARVAGTDISNQEWDRTHQREIERITAEAPGLDRKLLDTPAARYATLERMVGERVLEVVARQSHVAVSDARLARELTQIPAVAELRKPDGTMDVQAYRDLLARQGYTPESFEASVRFDLARNQVARGVAESSWLTGGAAKATLEAFFERREVQVKVFAPLDFQAKVQVSDADVQAYHAEHAAEFQSPQTVDVDYVVLDLDALARQVKVDEAELRAYHEQNQASLSGNETRRASHILLTVPEGASAEARAEVRSKTEGLLAQLRQSPGRFAELAAAESQDPGSAAKGGDLGFFGRGAMVKPFEDAVYALEKGGLSNVVETEFGYHIIQLTDINRPASASFESVRAQIESEYRRQQAQQRYAESAETFSNLVYEQSDTLAPAAEALGLSVSHAKGLLRSGKLLQGEAPTPLAQAKVLEALFGPDALQKQHNIAAVETGPSQLLSARVVRHQPAAVLPLAQVADQVRSKLIAQRALQMAKDEGAKALAAWREQAPASLPAPVLISRDQPSEVSPTVVRALLATPLSGDQPVWSGVDLGAQGYAVARIIKRVPRPVPDADVAAQEREQLGRMWAVAEGEAYVSALKRQLKAEITVVKPTSGAAAARAADGG